MEIQTIRPGDTIIFRDRLGELDQKSAKFITRQFPNNKVIFVHGDQSIEVLSDSDLKQIGLCRCDKP